MARMQDQCRAAHQWRQRADVGVEPGPHQICGVFRCGRQTHHLVERLKLLRRAAGNELVHEQLPERRVGLAPAHLDQPQQRFFFGQLLCRLAAGKAPTHERPVENQMTDALRVAGRVSHGGGAAARKSEKDKRLRTKSVRHRFQVLNVLFEGKGDIVPV